MSGRLSLTLYSASQYFFQINLLLMNYPHEQCSHWNSHCEFYSQCEVFCKMPNISYTLLEKTHIALPGRSSTNINQLKLSEYIEEKKTCLNLLKRLTNAPYVQPCIIHDVACILNRKDKPFLCSGKTVSNKLHKQNLTFFTLRTHILYTFNKKAHTIPFMGLSRSKLTSINFSMGALHE